MVSIGGFLQIGTVFVNVVKDTLVRFDVFGIIYLTVLANGISSNVLWLELVIRVIQGSVSCFCAEEDTAVFSFGCVR